MCEEPHSFFYEKEEKNKNEDNRDHWCKCVRRFAILWISWFYLKWTDCHLSFHHDYPVWNVNDFETASILQQIQQTQFFFLCRKIFSIRLHFLQTKKARCLTNTHLNRRKCVLYTNKREEETNDCKSSEKWRLLNCKSLNRVNFIKKLNWIVDTKMLSLVLMLLH